MTFRFSLLPSILVWVSQTAEATLNSNALSLQNLEPPTSCDEFYPENMSQHLINANLPNYGLGDCQQASLEAEKILYSYLKNLNPTFHYIWGTTAIGGGHAWVVTDVCKNSYITDLAGGSIFMSILGFDKIFFNPVSESSWVYDQRTALQYVSQQPADPQNDEFQTKQETAFFSMQNRVAHMAVPEGDMINL